VTCDLCDDDFDDTPRADECADTLLRTGTLEK